MKLKLAPDCRRIFPTPLLKCGQFRKNPGLMNGGRRARVAKGAGRPIHEVNRLLEQFREMQKMMKKMGNNPGGRPPKMPGMFR